MAQGGRLAGKVALISGAARGQGAAEGLLFAREGARVVLGDVLADELAATVATIEAQHPGQVVGVPLDVSSEDAWQAAVATAEERFGGLDVLVNNAGVTNERWGGLMALEDMPLEAWNGLMAINLTGVFLGIKTAAPLIRRTVAPKREADVRVGGSIVNISSAQGMLPSAFQGNYAASKWGVRGLTKVAASELAPHIRVNAVLPGPIRTPMVSAMLDDNTAVLKALVDNVPLDRVAVAEEVADLVLFLASDESSYSTGGDFVVDGGRVAVQKRPR